MKTMQFGQVPGVMTSDKLDAKPINPELNSDNNATLYQKCLYCPDYGVTCNGPKLAALGDIMEVRKFHRAIRDKRGIPMKMIYLAATPVGESTINDYFSHSVKDFKWTTVGAIDNALTAICGNRVGKPLLDHPCPASSTEIQDKMNQYDGKVSELMQENQRLQQKVTETKGKVISARDEVKEDYASRVNFLKDLCEKRERDIDEMADKHQKEIARMDAVAADYLSRIDEKNRRIDRLNKAIHILSFCLICTIVCLTCYLVWDLIHPTAGFFVY